MEKIQSLLLPLLTANWWMAHWQHVGMFICVLYFIKVIAKRDEHMQGGRAGVLTIPGIITTILNDAIIIGLFTIFRRF